MLLRIILDSYKNLQKVINAGEISGLKGVAVHPCLPFYLSASPKPGP